MMKTYSIGKTVLSVSCARFKSHIYEAPFVHKLFKIISLCFSHYILIIDLIYYKIKQKIIIKQINRKYGSDYLLYKHNPKVIIYYINTTQK